MQNCAVPAHSGGDDDGDYMNDVLQHCIKKLHTPESNTLKRAKLWQSIQNEIPFCVVSVTSGLCR